MTDRYKLIGSLRKYEGNFITLVRQTLQGIQKTNHAIIYITQQILMLHDPRFNENKGIL